MKNKMLKHASLVVGICLLNFQSFGQAPQTATTPTKEAEADSTLARIELFTDEYAKVMETWSPEKKKRFVETFVFTRGQIKIPEKPIVWSNEEE
jgi:hypothetical protein